MNLGAIDGRRGRRQSGGREAAVLIPVIDRPNGYHLVFIKRSDDLSEHAGQMSFPGGSREPHDPDFFATATREANEEIGLDQSDIEPVGELDDITTTTEYVVRPFVSRVPDRQFTPDGVEVAEIAILPVDAFCRPENYEYDLRKTPTGKEYRIHSFSVDGYRVWGATGNLVVQLLDLTTDWEPNVMVE